MKYVRLVKIALKMMEGGLYAIWDIIDFLTYDNVSQSNTLTKVTII